MSSTNSLKYIFHFENELTDMLHENVKKWWAFHIHVSGNAPERTV